MSRGLGKVANRMLFRLYDKGKTLDELHVSSKGNTRMSDYYVLQRLIAKELVWKSDRKETYYLTDKGKEISYKLHKEFLNMLQNYLDFFPRARYFGSYNREDKKELQQYVNEKAEIALERDIVLMDFYSESCEPCKELEPFIDRLEKEEAFLGKIQFKKIDTAVTAVNTDMAAKYNIAVVPTVIIEKNGMVLNRFTGLRTDSQIQIYEALEEAVKKR